MKLGIFITTYNRPEYLRLCFESLKRADLPKGTSILIVDDASSSQETCDLINCFELGNIPVEKHQMNVNSGIKEVIKYACSTLFKECDTAILLDGDTVVSPDFAQVLVSLKKLYPDNIISGIDCRYDNRNPVISENPTQKKHLPGQNCCFSKSDYEKYILPALNKEGNWDFNVLHPNNIIISSPSVVQHIGVRSAMGHFGVIDHAHDFKLLNLPDVTLFGIDAHDPNGIKRAADICQMFIGFGDIKIITERLFSGREAYSKFCIKDMVKYINTSHVLIIHPDGYIQNYNAWENEWLQYDYIGASWGFYDNKNNGNGGFSLRSKKLLEILSKIDLGCYHPEDEVIGRELRPMLERKYGIKFAPAEVCNKFSIEAYGASVWKDRKGYTGNEYCDSFGFHGYHVSNLPIPPLPKVGSTRNLISKLHPKYSKR